MKSIEERYQIINKIYEIDKNNYHSLIESSEFQHSLLCLYSKVLQIELLNENITNQEINYYNSQILLRVLLEHYLVGYYIFLKIQNDKNDNVGLDF